MRKKQTEEQSEEQLKRLEEPSAEVEAPKKKVKKARKEKEKKAKAAPKVVESAPVEGEMPKKKVRRPRKAANSPAEASESALPKTAKAEGSLDEPKWSLRAKVFNICQYATHPDREGEELLSEETIQRVCTSYKTINRWAYIYHDQDTYAEGEREGVPEGTLKLPHWHIVLQLKSLQSVGTVAKWFDIPPQYVDVPRGRLAFADCVGYLTHKFCDPDLGKTVYDDSAVKASFDWVEYYKSRVTASVSQAERYNSWIKAVMNEGKTLRECQNEDDVTFVKFRSELTFARGWYLREVAPLPSQRMNILITGAAGDGKSVLAKALAMSLVDPEFTKDPRESYFIAGQSGVTFSGYDGQPVIIWDDSRVTGKGGLLEQFGREVLFKMFDLHPVDKFSLNVKYGSTCLVNCYNIMTTPARTDEEVEAYIEGFVAKMKDPNTGEWTTKEDEGQAYRRFPIIFRITAEEVIVLINAHYFGSPTDVGRVGWSNFQVFGKIHGSVRKSASVLSGRNKALGEGQIKVFGSESSRMVNELRRAETMAAGEQEIDPDIYNPITVEYGNIQTDFERYYDRIRLEWRDGGQRAFFRLYRWCPEDSLPDKYKNHGNCVLFFKFLLSESEFGDVIPFCAVERGRCKSYAGGCRCWECEIGARFADDTSEGDDLPGQQYLFSDGHPRLSLPAARIAYTKCTNLPSVYYPQSPENTFYKSPDGGFHIVCGYNKWCRYDGKEAHSCKGCDWCNVVYQEQF